MPEGVIGGGDDEFGIGKQRLAGGSQNAVDMVGMHVGNQQCIDLVRRDADRLDSGRKSAE
jgi:hypothetical protein